MLNFKTFSEFVRLIEGKFFKEIPTIDPTVKGSLTRASTTSTAAAGVSLQEGIADAVKQSFPQTAEGEFLESFGSYNNIEPFGEQGSAGQGAASGVLGTFVPQDTPVTYNGNSYITISDSTVQTFSGNIGLSFSAGIVTAETTAEHSLSTGLSVDISGATQTEYNGTFIITVLDSETFTYELTAGSLTTDNGQYTSDYAVLSIESANTGANQNVAAGAVMTINVTNMDGTLKVGADEISGGLDEESEEDFRARVLETNNLTPGIATAPSLSFSAKTIAGNTRVFVVRPDGTTGGTQGDAGYKPQLGETVMYILRDDDPSILPSSQQLQDTKDKIIADGMWPSYIEDEFLYVLAPILKEQDFVFTSITPNTTTMQNAIDDQLVSFFEDNAEIEGDIELDILNSFLRQVQDPTTGAFLTAFTYTTPSTTMTADSGEILTKGDVSFG